MRWERRGSHQWNGERELRREPQGHNAIKKSRYVTEESDEGQGFNL